MKSILYCDNKTWTEKKENNNNTNSDIVRTFDVIMVNIINILTHIINQDISSYSDNSKNIGRNKKTDNINHQHIRIFNKNKI